MRQRFYLTTRRQANRQAVRYGSRYLDLARSLTAWSGSQPVAVPVMRGVDRDMTHWSMFMLLQHNAIVNRSITSIVQSLKQGQKPKGPGAIDPKKEVLPDADAGPAAMRDFSSSIEDHLQTVSELGRLRGTMTHDHPLFGPFDAHQWHCMFAFHLLVHLKQARLIAQGAKQAVQPQPA